MTDMLRFLNGWTYRAVQLNVANRYGRTDRIHRLVMESPTGEIEETCTWADLP